MRLRRNPLGVSNFHFAANNSIRATATKKGWRPRKKNIDFDQSQCWTMVCLVRITPSTGQIISPGGDDSFELTAEGFL
jgi:hypothetical protein